jgi:hypothetical protein
MPLVLPPAANYQNPMNSVPAIFGAAPPEGARLVPIDIIWAAMGGPNNCVHINLFGGAAATLSQIVALSVDNSACAADVQFLFADTAQTYTVPAYAPNSTFAVFTNSTEVYVLSPLASGNDATRFCIHNTLPPPVALPLTALEQQTAVFDNIPVANGTTVLIAPPASGVLEGITVSFQFTATACNVIWQLTDGEATPKVLAGGQSAASPISNDNINIISFSQSGLFLRFLNGVRFVQAITGSGAGAAASVNLYYRSP